MSNATALKAVDLSTSEFPVGVLMAFLVAWPLLFPFVAGPSAGAWQLLASWGCVALMVLLTLAVRALKVPSAPIAGWLAMTALLVALGMGTQPQPALIAVAAIVVVGLAACVGAAFGSQSLSTQSWLARGLLVAGLISALLGLLQYYDLAKPLVPWTTAPGPGQAYGNLRQRNQFASFINVAMIAALWLHFTARSRQLRGWLQAAIVLLVTAQAAATSRTGLLQLICIASLCAFVARRERQKQPTGSAFGLPGPGLLLALIPLYFFIGWLLPQLTAGGVEGMGQRLREGAPPGHSRLLLWDNVLTLIAQHPWGGWGWGELSFAHFETVYDGPRFVEILDNAHNLPLHLAVELGIPAALLICGGFTWLVFAEKPWHERDPARVMVWGVLAVILLHSLLEYPLWYGPFQVLFGLCLGMLWCQPDRARPVMSKLTVRLASVGAAAALMLGLVYAAYDYLRISQIYLPPAERIATWRDGTLAKIDGSWLFANQVDFARLTLTPATRANAADVHSLARQVLHFSPEPSVVSKLIESAALLKLDNEAEAQARRFKIAYPLQYRQWLDEEPPTPLPTR